MYLEEKRDMENAIIERAYKDEEFRHALTSGNAAQAISEAFGREVRFNINVYSDTPDTVNIVLPNFEESSDVELTDDQLEEVAGGAASLCTWSCGSTSCGVTGCGTTYSEA